MVDNSAARRVQREAGARLLAPLLDQRLALIVILVLLAGILAYQTAPAADIAVGWVGDQLFLPTSEGQAETDAGHWYGDEPTDTAQHGRSRWTREYAVIDLPGLGAGGNLSLRLRVQGWPADVLHGTLRQPVVTVEANGAIIGRFTPTTEWADYRFSVPALQPPGDRLQIVLRSDATFTATQRYPHDTRPKGIRLEQISVRGQEPLHLALPAPGSLGLFALNGVLCFALLALLTRRQTAAFVMTAFAVSAAAMGLALARVWAVALLPWGTLTLGSALLLLQRRAVIGLVARVVQRYAQGNALNYGLSIAGAAWLVYVLARASMHLSLPGLERLRENLADSLLFGLLGMGLVILVLVQGRRGLPRLCDAIVGAINTRNGALALLGLFLVVWVGYEFAVVRTLPYVGHADYADNAVVARNLVAGRGWVVDYVTQFYRLYDHLTRPQETWPLLQPVWIAVFFVLFGVSDSVAKTPNLIAISALALLIYAAGTRLWDRRVGLTAVVLVLTSYLFFRLVIYTTSDLAFTLFVFGAIYLVYVWTAGRWRAQGSPARSMRRVWLPGAAGVLTGLMLLQKPGSGVLIAGGMGLWLVAWAWRSTRGAQVAAGVHPGLATPARSGRPRVHSTKVLLQTRLEMAAGGLRAATARPLWAIGIWGAVALLIFAPYLVRNSVTFGAPFYTTESHDAWVLGYTDWEDLYKVYTPEAGLSSLGVPDRSWVLRWGFDRAFTKLRDQVLAVRSYLLPPLYGIAAPPLVVGRGDKEALFFEMGAWLILLGMLGALRSRRRLLSLLLFAFGPYTLFLVTYWHANEERYFVVLMPWLALLAAYAVWHGYDRIAVIGDGRWTPVGLALAVAALVLVVQPSWPKIAEKVRDEPRRTASDLAAYTWLRANTAPDAVVMTRVPWQLNWHSNRPALMIPNTTDRSTFMRIARYYNARYLVLDVAERPNKDVQQFLNTLVADGSTGFTKVYESPVYDQAIGRTFVYRFPTNDHGVAETRP